VEGWARAMSGSMDFCSLTKFLAVGAVEVSCCSARAAQRCAREVAASLSVD